MYYSKYPRSEYPQLESKEDRPYIHIQIEHNGLIFAIPLRSNIQHPHAFFTDKKNRCGADYSKAVPITDEDISLEKPYIRPNEHQKLIGKEYKIKNGLKKYIQSYKDALLDIKYEHREQILAYSSLQYFHEELKINSRDLM